MILKDTAARMLRYVSGVHIKGDKPDIFLLSAPRSGSTWVMEIIAADRYVRACNEPFNLRKPEVVKKLGIADWDTLARAESLPRMEEYLRRLSSGGFGYTFKNLRPFMNGYHFFTNRVVFKILFACEGQISWLRETFDSPIVGLVRHPIPVSLSREELPRLTSLLEFESARFLTPVQRKYAENILQHGSLLEQAQLDWCLQNLPLLRQPELLDLMFTYEQLVLQPDLIIDRLAETLRLEDRDALCEAYNRLSGSVSKSSDASRKILLNRQQNRGSVIAKWRDTVGESQERQLMNILGELGIDAYRAGCLYPDRKYWVGDDWPPEQKQTG